MSAAPSLRGFARKRKLRQLQLVQHALMPHAVRTLLDKVREFRRADTRPDWRMEALKRLHRWAAECETFEQLRDRVLYNRRISELEELHRMFGWAIVKVECGELSAAEMPTDPLGVTRSVIDWWYRHFEAEIDSYTKPRLRLTSEDGEEGSTAV
jgi:hypothetical protein